MRRVFLGAVVALFLGGLGIAEAQQEVICVAGCETSIEGEVTIDAQPADDPHFVQCSKDSQPGPCDVTGTVSISGAVDLGAVDNAVLDDIADGIPVTNAGTFATQNTNARSDTDDGSMAVGQINDRVNAFSMHYDGSVWRRVQFSISTSDTISSNGDSVELTAAAIGGFGSVKVQTLDSYSGTWEVQCSVDGTNYDAAAELQLRAADSSTIVTSVTDAVGIWDVVNPNACQKIKVIATADFAATDTVVAISAMPWGGGAGGGGGGSSDATAANQVTANSYLANISGGVNGLQFDVDIKEINGVAPNPALTADFDTSGSTQTRDAVGIAVPASGGGVVVKGVEDEAHTDGDGLVGVATRRIDVAASSAGASGDYATANTDALGLMWTRLLDPCSGVAKSYINIDITTATTTELTSALAGANTHYYVCALSLVTDAANDVALVDDDSDNCGSVTSGLAGGLTAAEGWNFAANGGMTLGNGQGSVMRTGGTNRVLCLVTGAATQLSGHIVVAAAP